LAERDNALIKAAMLNTIAIAQKINDDIAHARGRSQRIRCYREDYLRINLNIYS